MAYNDIKSTGERISSLKNIRKQIDLCIKNCQLAQQFYGSETGAANYGDFDLLWEGVESRLAAAEACADLAIAELTLLTTSDGFVFQYEWVIGKRGVSFFSFNADADSITIFGSNAIVSGAGVVVKSGDFIDVTGTATSDRTYVVTAGSSDRTILVLDGIDLDEPCETPGAKIKLRQRLV